MVVIAWSDEIFGGYPWYRDPEVRRWTMKPLPVR